MQDERYVVFKMTNVNRAWVYLLPLLHVLACVATAAFAAMYVNTEWTYVVFADYPVSLVVVGLAWHYKWPLFPLFAIIGTLWWYLVSLVVAFCWTRASSAIRNRRTPRPEPTTR